MHLYLLRDAVDGQAIRIIDGSDEAPMTGTNIFLSICVYKDIYL
jgi:hypothetical protein